MKTLPSVRSVIYNILTFWWFDAALSQALCSVCSLEVITIFSKRSTFSLLLVRYFVLEELFPTLTSTETELCLESA